MSNTSISSSLEDYLETIAELQEIEGHAHTKAIATRLNVSMASVSSALQSLSNRALIDYRPNAPVTLTPSGAERAAVIRNRHHAMRVFFSEVLKLDNDEANETACKIEHVIGEKVMARFTVLAEAITLRDDCRALRSFLNDELPKIKTDDEEPAIPLAALPIGESAMITNVSPALRERRKFADLGLVPGVLVRMSAAEPLGGQLRIKVHFNEISVGMEDAKDIFVQPTRSASDL